MEIINNLEGYTYLTCTACMSVFADGLSWANANNDKIVTDIEKADNIVILSCQVTDLAILNDIRHAEMYHKKYPDKNIYISGCLAMREDVELPKFCKRLETPRCNYQAINNRELVHFEKPFWIKGFTEENHPYCPGHLFRNMYPLRIGKGCPNKCTYCTIRITRGCWETYESELLEKEFIEHDNILLIADSPDAKQITEWCNLAIKHDKQISVRNIEPTVAVKCMDLLLDLAELNLLKIFHCPIQSNNEDVLRDMGRRLVDTSKTIEYATQLKNLGVFIATNIIVDYKNFKQDFTDIYKLYDYVSWNPYWDGVWNRSIAESRYKKYFNQ